MEIKSTYGIKTNFSYKDEFFYYIPLTWRLGVNRIELVKIRVAGWKPKGNRENQAIFYFDVKTKNEALEIIDEIKDYDFKRVENFFEKLYLQYPLNYNTGERYEWLEKIAIPATREKFKNFQKLL